MLKTLHRKLKPTNTNPTKNQGELRCSGRVGSSCSACDYRWPTMCKIIMIWQKLKHNKYITVSEYNLS